MGHPRGPGGPGGRGGSGGNGFNDLRRDLTATKRRYVKKKLSIKSRAGTVAFFIVSLWRFLLTTTIFYLFIGILFITVKITIVMGLV